jgi:hypothetical protein
MFPCRIRLESPTETLGSGEKPRSLAAMKTQRKKGNAGYRGRIAKRRANDQEMDIWLDKTRQLHYLRLIKNVRLCPTVIEQKLLYKC